MSPNTIIVASSLRTRYPHVYEEIRAGCNASGVRFLEFESLNIWPRDYLPLQVHAGGEDERFVEFAYRGYGGKGEGFKAYPWLRVGPCAWAELFEGRKVVRSSIVLDGGNVTRNCNGDVAVLTEIVFRHNPTVPRAKLIALLEKLLEAEIVLVPVEPGDDIGHTDGCLTFVPDEPRTVLLNDYARYPSKACARYATRIQRALSKAGIAFHLLPFAYHRCPALTKREFRRRFPLADSFNPGFGYYVNLLHAGPLVLVPRFGIEEDAAAFACVKRHFRRHRIFSVDCADLSMEGGLVNCVTADYAL